MVRLVFMCVLLAAVAGCPNEPNCRGCAVDPHYKIVCEDTSCYLGFVNAQKKCVVTPEAQRIEYCEAYEDTSAGKPAACKLCQHGYSAVQGRCVACKVSGCAVCEEVDQCSACGSGRKLDLAKNECLSTPNDEPHCAVCKYTGQDADKCQCLLCDFHYTARWIVDLKAKKCVEDEVGNCQEFSFNNPKKCAKCLPGFYLTLDDKCRANTEPPSPNPQPDPSNDSFWIHVLKWVVFVLTLGVSLWFCWWWVSNWNRRKTGHYQRAPGPEIKP